MRSVFMTRFKRGGALLALLAILITPALFADEPITGDPQAKIRPPVGVAGQVEEPSLIETFWVWLQARIGLPPG